MLHVAFTIDYEIYGNGAGDLSSLVVEPTRRLIDLFEEASARFVCFAEAAEFRAIDAQGSDPAIGSVRTQLREMHAGGFEIALHLHPQWSRARFVDGTWQLDESEYNLCRLPTGRIRQIVEESIGYLRDVLGEPAWEPYSFRAGNWLLQPTERVAEVLREAGVKLDSSVSKGLVQAYHGLDYRPALRNPRFWRFDRDVNRPASPGILWEVPIHTVLVPFWRMMTRKRISLQRRADTGGRSLWRRCCTLRDRARLFYPLKFDFCRMSYDEMRGMVEEVLGEEGSSGRDFVPMVAIGHSKDLVDFESIRRFLGFLRENGVRVCTLEQMGRRLSELAESARTAPRECGAGARA